jgi:hypothetical protein
MRTSEVGSDIKPVNEVKELLLSGTNNSSGGDKKCKILVQNPV